MVEQEETNTIIGDDSASSSIAANNCIDKVLNGSAFGVLPKILSREHCSNALDEILDFYIDICNGKVLKNADPTTTPWSNNPEVYPTDGKFNNFGAGWLLGNIREVLATKVYEPLLQTRELHSSKEGFRLVLSNLGSETLRFSSGQNNEANSPDAFYRSISVLSSGGSDPDTTIRLHIIDKDNKQEAVALSEGDVLLYRSDLVKEVFEEYYVDRTKEKNILQAVPIVSYCTMIKVTGNDLNSSTPNFYVDAYKQRRTDVGDPTTYFMSSKPNSNNSGPPPQQTAASSLLSCRCYFRAHPPLLTRRQAELYGLLPYKSNDWDKEWKRVTIRGICFQQFSQMINGDSQLVSNEYESLPAKIEKPCQAQSIQLTSSDENVLVGQDKYLGGMASPCGKYIYGVPGTARRLLRISTKTGVMDCIGPSYTGKFKWLRGVEIPASVMSQSSNKFPDGCCIALPCNSLSFLKVNPSNDEVYTFGQDILEDVCQDCKGWYYHGGNLASNGWIYCIPANARRVVKLNPVTDEVEVIGSEYLGAQKWYGGIIGSNGCIYGIPHNATTVLKIDPTTDEITLLEGTTEPLPTGKWKWHGGLAAGDKIIGFPNNSDQVLMVDCRKSTVYTIGDSNILKSGRHRVPQDGRYKYLGGALTGDNRCAYLFPCDAERVLRIDCHTEKLALVGPCLLDGENKFQNGFYSDRDGCLYGIPQRAIGVLRVTPGDDENGDDDHVDIIPCGEDMMNVKDKFEGGVLGFDGCIYCIPLKSKTCVKIIPQQK